MKLIIVDDDTLILKSLSITLSRIDDIHVIGCATNGLEALKLCNKQLPDIVLMDIRMPGIDGIATTRLIKQRYSNVRVMILTTFDDKNNIQQALSAGADGYLIKTDKISSIAEKLRVLMDGTSVVESDVLKKLTMIENPILDKLTSRERNIARLVAQGLTNKEISAQLFLSEGTVRNNVVIIMEKLCVKNRTMLSKLYYENNS